MPGVKDTAAAFPALDSGVAEGIYGDNPCAPIVPAETVTVSLATNLSESGNYLVCERVPVTSTADDTVLFVSTYGSAQLTGDGALVFAKAGTTVNASGAGAVVIAVADARVTVLSSDATVVRCPDLEWRTPYSTLECPGS
jgi:hypothetical protein